MAAADMNPEHRLANIALEVTRACNLRCRYCYLGKCGDNLYAAFQDRHMGTETGRRALDSLLALSSPMAECSVCFIGGEPLLNWGLITDLVTYGESLFKDSDRTIGFGLTTNGLLLDEEKLRFLLDHRVSMTLSFDGTRRAQDSMRCGPSGEGTYDRLMNVAGLIRRCRGSLRGRGLNVRATVTRREPDVVVVAEALDAMGFERFALTPVTASADTQDFAFRKEDMPELLRSYGRLADRFYDRLVSGVHEPVSWFRKFLERIATADALYQSCGAARGYVGVDVDGNFCLCHRFFGTAEAGMGSLDAGLDRSVTDRILALPVDRKPDCARCWARKYCGGPCYYEAYFHNGNFMTPDHNYCSLIRYSISRSLEMYARLLREKPDLAAGFVNRKGEKQDPQLINCPSIDESGRPEEIVNALEATYPRPFRRNHVLIREIGEEMILYDQNNQSVFSINHSARAIWELCDGTRSPTEICGELARRFDLAEADMLQDVRSAIAHFGRCGLLEIAARPSPEQAPVPGG